MSGAPVDQFHRKEFWLDLNPRLSLTGIPLRVGAPAGRQLRPGEREAQSCSLRQRGYYVFDELVPAETCVLLADAVSTLVANDIPTPFLFVYDEAWQLLGQIETAIESLVGSGFLVGGDLWVWHVDATDSAAGWSPHRDDNMGDAVLPDGGPGLISVWIALTEATPANGCMYIVPVDRDPNVPDNLDGYDVSRPDLPSIRALPAPAGTAMGWSTRVLHWGGRSSSDAVAPRMSVSIYCQRADVERYHDDFIDFRRSVPLHYRLGIVSRALLIYQDSSFAGTAISGEVVAFAKEQRERLSTWLAMAEDLRGTFRAVT